MEEWGESMKQISEAEEKPFTSSLNIHVQKPFVERGGGRRSKAPRGNSWRLEERGKNSLPTDIHRLDEGVEGSGMGLFLIGGHLLKILLQNLKGAS